MAVDNQSVLREVKEAFGQVPGWMAAIPPPAVTGFWTLFRDLELGETKIPNKYKELIGLAVSGATRCRYCALFHTESAKLNGASDEEIAEASMMGALTMCASTFLNAEQIDFEKFRSETKDIVAYVKRTQAGKKPASREQPVHA